MMTINKFELLTSLTKEGFLIEHTDLAFQSEEETCNGVRIYVCRNGKNTLTFACGQAEVVNVLFFQTIPQITQSTPCHSIKQIMEFMKKDSEEKKQ
jgi:hypothetical protein